MHSTRKNGIWLNELIVTVSGEVEETLLFTSNNTIYTQKTVNSMNKKRNPSNLGLNTLSSSQQSSSKNSNSSSSVPPTIRVHSLSKKYRSDWLMWSIFPFQIACISTSKHFLGSKSSRVSTAILKSNRSTLG